MSQKNVERIEVAYAALNRRDLDAFLAGVHPEAEFRSLTAESEGRTYCGHDGARAWWADVVLFGRVRFELENTESFRDRGITRLRIVATIDGVEVPQTMWQAWRVRDGQVCWWESFRSEAEALEAVALSE